MYMVEKKRVYICRSVLQKAASLRAWQNFRFDMAALRRFKSQSFCLKDKNDWQSSLYYYSHNYRKLTIFIPTGSGGLLWRGGRNDHRIFKVTLCKTNENFFDIIFFHHVSIECSIPKERGSFRANKNCNISINFIPD